MNFIKRNRPIFFVGVVTAVIFVVVIVIGQLTKSGPNLTNSPQTFDISERENNYENNNNSGQYSGEIVLTPPEEVKPEPPKKVLPVLQVEFSEIGFRPQTVNGQQDQVIKWTNNTDQPITIVELIKKNDEFPKELVIDPLASFELPLKGKGFWTYKEVGSDHIGRVLINQ